MDRSESAIFINRWRALPTELKLQILKEIIPTNQVYRSIGFGKSTNPKLFLKGHGHDFDFEKLVFPLLTCSEIALFTKEIFYGHNTMLIRNIPVADNLRYTPKGINHFVRHLRLVLDLKSKDLDFVRKLGQGLLGFGHLQNVEIRLNNRHRWNHDEVLMDEVGNFPSITIAALHLDIQLRYHHPQPQTADEEYTAEQRIDAFRTLLDKINIVGPNKIFCSEERHSDFDEGDMVDIVTISKRCDRERC